MAAHWGKIIDESHTGSAEIEVTNWAGRYAQVATLSPPTFILTGPLLTQT